MCVHVCVCWWSDQRRPGRSGEWYVREDLKKVRGLAMGTWGGAEGGGRGCIFLQSKTKSHCKHPMVGEEHRDAV